MSKHKKEKMPAMPHKMPNGMMMVDGKMMTKEQMKEYTKQKSQMKRGVK